MTIVPEKYFLSVARCACWIIVASPLSCTHARITDAGAIERAQTWVRANPRFVSQDETSDCDWTARIDGDFWVVQMHLGPRSGIGTDCYCARRFYVRAATGEPICMLCGGGFSIRSIEPGGCAAFLPPER